MSTLVSARAVRGLRGTGSRSPRLPGRARPPVLRVVGSRPRSTGAAPAVPRVPGPLRAAALLRAPAPARDPAQLHTPAPLRAPAPADVPDSAPLRTASPVRLARPVRLASPLRVGGPDRGHDGPDRGHDGPDRGHDRPAGVAGAPVAAPPPLRFTRRGRWVTGLAVLAAVAVPAVSGHLATPAGTPVPDVAVQSGGFSAIGTVSAVRPWSAGSSEAERVVAGKSAAPAGWVVVTALPGDSLWTIAGRTVPGVDRRGVIRQIVARNGLVGTEISAGDALLVPTA